MAISCNTFRKKALTYLMQPLIKTCTSEKITISTLTYFNSANPNYCSILCNMEADCKAFYHENSACYLADVAGLVESSSDSTPSRTVWIEDNAEVAVTTVSSTTAATTTSRHTRVKLGYNILLRRLRDSRLGASHAT